MTEKPTLVLVPGLSCDADLFRHQTVHLSDCVEMIVADTLRDDSIGGMAQRLLDMVRVPVFSLAGLSMGGYVVQEVMRRAPHRVERLALLNTNARADTPEQSASRCALVDAAHAGKFDVFLSFALKTQLYAPHAENALLRERVLGMMRRVGPEVFVRQQQAIMGRMEGRNDLSSVSCPLLCVAGRQDNATPLPLLEEIARTVQRGTLVVIEECGHLSPLEQPQAVTALLRYWLQMC